MIKLFMRWVCIENKIDMNKNAFGEAWPTEGVFYRIFTEYNQT